MDKLQHLFICFFFTLIFNWKIGATVGITIEATQLESYWQVHGTEYTYKNYRWKDTYGDLFYDVIGIKLAVDLRKLIGRGK